MVAGIVTVLSRLVGVADRVDVACAHRRDGTVDVALIVAPLVPPSRTPRRPPA